jgi:hypothetical protein
MKRSWCGKRDERTGRSKEIIVKNIRPPEGRFSQVDRGKVKLSL